ncbi:MAG: zinc ABC transporter substrate-binding protein [Pseudomonadota bacterium]
MTHRLTRSVSFRALAAAGVVAGLTAVPASQAFAQDEPLKVVASFSILADMVSNVGGDLVKVSSIVGPDEDAHVYEPVPTDVVGVTEADLVFINGIGFEGFMERLVESSGTEAAVVTVSDGIDVIENEDDHDDHGDEHASHDDDDHDHDHGDEHASHDDHDHDHDHGDEHASHDDHDHDHDHGDEHASHDDHDHDHDHGDEHASHDDHDHGDEHGDDHAGHDDHGDDDHAGHDHHDHDHGPIDPHAWQSLDAAQVYVANIAAGLCSVDAENCATFEENAAAYSAELEALEAELAAALDGVPAEERIVITGHDAFGYLARDFDMTFLSPQGLSTESEASASDVAAIVDQIMDTGARAMFVENISDSRLIETIAAETGLQVASAELYSDALSGPDGPASTYIGMMRHNMSAIIEALSGS